MKSSRPEIPPLPDSAEFHRRTMAGPDGKAATSDVLKAGDYFGRHEILRVASRKDNITVYRAWDSQLDREVALKTLDQAGHDGGLDLFFERARVAGRLHHPNIVAVLDAGTIGHVPYQTSAYVEGTTLSNIIDKGMPFTDAARLICTIANALQYAHDQRVLHLDLNPDHIVVSRAGEPNILCFGFLTKGDSNDVDSHLIAQRDKTAYMSPEQVEGNDELNPCADVWSIGVIFYELLTGRLPSRNRSGSHSSLHKFDVMNPRRSKRRIPKDLEAICLKSMKIDVVQRYQSCEALANDLNRWIKNEPIQARSVGVIGLARRWCWRNPTVAFLASISAVMLLTLSVGLGLVAFRIRQSQQSIETALSSADEYQSAARDKLASTAETTVRLRQLDERLHRVDNEITKIRRSTTDLKSELLRVEELLGRVAMDLEKTKSELGRHNAQLAAAKKSLQNEEQRAIRAANLIKGTWFDYEKKMQQANSAVEEGRIQQAKTILKQCPVQHRSWEWRYLNHRCTDSAYPKLTTFPATNKNVLVSGDGQWVATYDYHSVEIQEKATAKTVFSRACDVDVHNLFFTVDSKYFCFSSDGHIYLLKAPFEINKRATEIRLLQIRSKNAQLQTWLENEGKILSVYVSQRYDGQYQTHLYKVHLDSGKVIDQQPISSRDRLSMLVGVDRNAVLFLGKTHLLLDQAVAKNDFRESISMDGLGRTQYPWHRRLTTDIAVDPKTNRVARNSVIWDMESGQQLGDFKGVPLSFSRDGKRLMVLTNSEAANRSHSRSAVISILHVGKEVSRRIFNVQLPVTKDAAPIYLDASTVAYVDPDWKEIWFWYSRNFHVLSLLP